MSPLTKLALTLAVALSGVAILDALLVGINHEPSVFADESGMSLPLLAVSLLHAATYVALALLLHVHRDRISAGSLTRRVLRIGLETSYLSMAVFFGPVIVGTWVNGGDPADIPDLLDLPAALGFVGLFLFTIALGASLLKVPGMRLPALLLTAVTGGVGVTILLGALGSDFAHPAYPEVLAYIGTALTGVRVTSRRDDRRPDANLGAVRPSAGTASDRSLRSDSGSTRGHAPSQPFQALTTTARSRLTHLLRTHPL
jgi:hypothetical protein